MIMKERVARLLEPESATNRVEEHVLVVAARLPCRKAEESRVLDVRALRSERLHVVV
jgi:hypothetical protein